MLTAILHCYTHLKQENDKGHRVQSQTSVSAYSMQLHVL